MHALHAWARLGVSQHALAHAVFEKPFAVATFNEIMGASVAQLLATGQAIIALKRLPEKVGPLPGFCRTPPSLSRFLFVSHSSGFVSCPSFFCFLFSFILFQFPPGPVPLSPFEVRWNLSSFCEALVVHRILGSERGCGNGRRVGIFGFPAHSCASF